jgi:hypothetical protein
LVIEFSHGHKQVNSKNEYENPTAKNVENSVYHKANNQQDKQECLIMKAKD